MFYAVRICGNPNQERYMRPIGFIVEGSKDNEDDEVTLERETRVEVKKVLEEHGLYEAGWVEIIEID